MSHRLRKSVPLVILAGLTVGVLVGCPTAPTGQSLTLENYTGYTMTEMNMRSTAKGELWGADQLRDTDLSGDGSADSTYTITAIPDGTYDLRALFNTPAGSTGKYAVYRFGVPVENALRWVFSLFTTSTGTYSNVQTIVDALLGITS